MRFFTRVTWGRSPQHIIYITIVQTTSTSSVVLYLLPLDLLLLWSRFLFLYLLLLYLLLPSLFFSVIVVSFHVSFWAVATHVEFHVFWINQLSRCFSRSCDQFVIFNPWKVRWNWVTFSHSSLVISPSLLYLLIRRDTGGLANEVFTSNSIVSWK